MSVKKFVLAIALSTACAGPIVAQRQVAAPVTDPNDPKFLTAQTRLQGGPKPPEQMALDFQHLDLATKVLIDEKRIETTATLTLKAKSDVPVLILDLFPKFEIIGIWLDGKKVAPADYSNPEGQLRIKLAKPLAAGKTIVAKVSIAGTPPLAKRPPWEGGTTWGRTPDGKYPWVDTSLWGGGCDMLYPCLDHPLLKPATSDLHYTVPTGLMAVGNGALVNKVDKGGWTTWNWHARSVHTYGSVLDVGPYKVMEGDYRSKFGNTIPMRFYYLPGEEEKAAELFSEFPQTLKFWEDVIGPYPWADQKMGVVRVPFSGLENQTINGYSDFYPKTAYGWDWLMNHEFSHEVFANQLSNANYDDLWLHEGLGSYAQPLLAQYLTGDLGYFGQLMAQRAGIRADKPLVSGAERDEKWVYADPTGPRGDIYPRGSWTAHTLRQLIGDAAFFKAIRILVYGREDPKPGNFQPQFGTTQGFLKTVNQVTGKDYKWFFDVYFYQAALPELLSDNSGGALKLRWKTEGNTPFPMPVDVLVDGKLTTLPMSDGTGQMPASATSAITLDPHSKILRRSIAIEKFQAWQASQPPRQR